MNLNLDTLKNEIREYLESEGFVLFHGFSRLADVDSFVAWDTDRSPDYRQFLTAAKSAGAKLIVFHSREFAAAHIDEATERLEETEFSAEDRRAMDRRLRELRQYEGFTCAIELSFDHQSRVYLFNLRAEWYEEYLDMLEEIDAALADEEEDDGEDLGGFYSRN